MFVASCDFRCDVLSFGFGRLPYEYMLYIHLVYIIICITQTVYPPISHTVLWPGVNGPFYVWDLLCKPNGV